MGGILRRLFPGLWSEPPRPEGYLTWAEIEQKYPGECVLLDHPTRDRFENVTGGTLLFHNKDRDEFDAELSRHDLNDFAVLHVYDPFAEPIFFFDWKYDGSWNEVSTLAETSSSSPPG